MELENILLEIEAKYKEAMIAKKNALSENLTEKRKEIDATIGSLKLIKSELLKENQRVYECQDYKMTRDQEILFLNAMAESRKENVKKYHNAGRFDLEEADAKELVLIQEFLPKMPTEDEIKEFIATTIDTYAVEQGSEYKLSMKDMGKIKTLVNATYPTINGGIIKDVLMSKL